MKIQVRVKPNSSEPRIEEFGERRYLVFVKGEAENNEANIEMINMIAKHLGVPARTIRIISGATNKDKTLEIGY